MNCPACDANLPDGSSFCGYCGSSIQADLACPSCERANPVDMRFCLGCGSSLAEKASERKPADYTPRHLADKILQAKSALEGERKQVTVLFADVQGSVELSEAVDPEVWHSILDGFFQILTDGVHRFEGTVNQYTGDGIMALFGAPIAHEDHPQRACYAALQLRDDLARYAREVKREHELGFSVRMGLHSGNVVVGKIGDDLRMDYTAQGLTVGLAARMQELASPDTVYLSADTGKLAAGYFELEDLGEFPVRGVRGPVSVFQLQGIGALRTRFDHSRARGLTRFVGRADDMEALETALARAREGNGEVVGVVGDAGVGKSRLCFEFLESCRAEGLTVLTGGGVPHGKNLPLLPILQVFREYYGITERDSDQQVREKIAGRMLLFDEEYRDVLPLLFEFFGAPDPKNPAPRMDPEARQRQLFGVLRRVTQRDLTRGVVVTLIEDLHWIDGASETWLEEWVDAIGGTQRLLIVNFRPEYHADWMQKSWYQQLPLAPLGPEAIAELLDDLLGSDPSTEGLADSIHARTAGNPFFTEEVVQSLVESGHLEGSRGSYRLVTPVERLEVPTRVQPLLASRIDRLPEREKQVLQTAAVIGQEFAEPLLEAVAELPHSDLDDSLRALKTAEFIREASLYPVAEYAFKHPLTQQVALDSQLRERRRGTHRAVAHTIEATYADKLDEQSALLAHHWEEAGQALIAARWHRRAAEWTGRNDIAEASRHWHRVRALIAEVPDEAESAVLGAEACRQILAWGVRLGISTEDEAEVYSEGKGWAAMSSDALAEGLLEQHYAITRAISGRIAVGVEHALAAERMLRRSEDEEMRALADWAAIYLLYQLGRLAEANERCTRLAEATRGHPEWGIDLWEVSAWVWTFFLRGAYQNYARHLDEARATLEQGVEQARARGEAENEGWILARLAEHGVLAGDPESGVRAGQRSVEIAEKIGTPLSRVLAYSALGFARASSGNAAEGVEAIEYSLAVARERGVALDNEAHLLAWLADACRVAGDLARARAAADDAIAAGRRTGARAGEIYAHWALARVLLEQDGAGAARAIGGALDAAESLADEIGARNFRPLLLLERAALARLENDSETRGQLLREAQRLFDENGAGGHAERVAGELAD